MICTGEISSFVVLGVVDLCGLVRVDCWQFPLAMVHPTLNLDFPPWVYPLAVLATVSKMIVVIEGTEMAVVWSSFVKLSLVRLREVVAATLTGMISPVGWAHQASLSYCVAVT